TAGWTPETAQWTQVGTTGANVTSFSATGLAAATTYHFRVMAWNAGGDSLPSSDAWATTPAAPTLPNAPSNLTATAVSRTQINLKWVDNAANEQGVKIERSTGGSWSQIATVGPNTTSYASTGLSKGRTYYFRVRAYNSVGNSAYSNTQSA